MKTTAMTDETLHDLKQEHPHIFKEPASVVLTRRGTTFAMFALFIYSAYLFDMTPERTINGLRRLGEILAFMLPPKIWTEWSGFSEVLYALLETLAMAFVGNFLAVVVSVPLAFFGAKTINKLTFLRFGFRRGFDIIRALETLILALIFIRAFGLGPLAGVLAIAVSEIGVLSKLFSEALENVSKKPIEGVTAAGGSRAQSIHFGMLPQVMPIFVSLSLYHLESNVRSSTILGIVGAGGIGLLLSDQIAAYRWDEAWSTIILIIFIVYLIDWLSSIVRGAIIGQTEYVK